MLHYTVPLNRRRLETDKAMLNRTILTALLAALLTPACADDNGPWNNKPAAVALTYDDALNVHLDNVVPALNRHSFKGTFYITVGFTPFGDRLDEWRHAAAEGHELGNHTLFHPCRGDLPNRDWLEPERYLDTWPRKRFVENLRVADIALRAVDGRSQRTFAYPCNDKTAGGEDYVGFIRERFAGARSVGNELQTIDVIDLYDVGSYMVNGESAKQLTALVDRAVERRALLVFLFHGVGGEHALNVAKEHHDALLEYLDKRRDDVWVAPMIDIVEHIKARRN